VVLDLSSSGPGTAPGSRSGNVIGRYATGIGYETIYGSSSGPRRDTAYALLPPLPTYHSQVQQSLVVQSQVVQGRKLRSQVPLIVLVLGLLLVVLDLLLVALLLLLVLPFLLLSPLFDPDHDRKNNALDLKDLHLPLLMMHLPLNL